MADLYGYISNKEEKPKNSFARSLTRLLMPETAENWFLGSKEDEDFLNKWSDSEIPTYEEIQNNYKNGIFSKKDVEDFSNLRNKYDTLSANREYTDVRNQNIGQGIVDIGTGLIGGGGALATKAGINVLKPYLGKKIAQTVTQGTVGGGLGGLAHGVGTGFVQEDINPVTQGLQEGVLGAAFGGLGGYGLGKISKNIDRSNAINTADFSAYVNDYLTDVKLPLSKKDLYDLRQYRLTKKFGNGSSDIDFDIVNPEFRKAQSELINDVNPAPNTYNTWIRSVKDIADPEEIFTQDEFMGTPDWYLEKAETALRNGEITVYSSYPIKDGVFVTPSFQEASGYAGGGKVYSKKVPLEDVAFIDSNEGQYAPRQSILKYLKNNNNGDKIELEDIENIDDIPLSKQEYAIFMHKMNTDEVNKPNNSLFNKIIDPNSYTVYKKNFNEYKPKGKDLIE